MQARGVGDRVDGDDLAAREREGEDHAGPATGGDDDSHGSVDERRSCGSGSPLDRPPGHGRRTTEIVADSGLPFTTLRATQFHDLILTVAQQLAKSCG